MASERRATDSVHAFTGPPGMNGEHQRSPSLKALANRVLSQAPQCSRSVRVDEHHSHTDEHETTDSSRDLDVGDIAAVLIKSAILDGALVWLVADDHILSQHPYLVRSGCPVVCFDEIARLRGKTRAELQAIGLVKSVFPTGRVLQ